VYGSVSDPVSIIGAKDGSISTIDDENATPTNADEDEHVVQDAVDGDGDGDDNDDGSERNEKQLSAEEERGVITKILV